MDYRDWGYDDRTPHERRPASLWSGGDEPRSADELSGGTSWGSTYRSTRALGSADLTDTDFDDAYWTPPSSAVPAPRGGGRHRDDSDPPEPPISSPASTGGFVARSSPVPTSGFIPSSSPAPTSGFPAPASGFVPTSAPVSSGGWRQSDRAAGWDRVTDTGEWRHAPEPGHWQRSDDTGEWTRSAYTDDWRDPEPRGWSEPADGRRVPRPRDWRDDTGAGEWRRGAHTGQFDRVTDTGGWSVDSEPDPWERPERSRRERRAAIETSWEDSGETFWSGTRLAGDDPRWVETPASAPRSPAVAYPRPARSRPAAPSARPVYRPPVRRGRGNRLDEELLDFDPGGYVAALLYTALWYAIPVLFFALWTLTLDNTPPPTGCVTDVTGGGCQSERAQAIASVIGGAPQFGAALLASLAVAIVLRWASGTWRAASVGLAAAVVGGGLSTVLFSALTGQPIG